jgi:copper(I)-binding protein
MRFRSLISFTAALLVSAFTYAHDYNAGNLRIEHPYARATVSGQPSGAAYLTIENKGNNPDRLIAIASPISNAVEMHTMSMDGNVMKMREVSSIELKPSVKVSMKPGDGYHIMLIGLKQPLKIGDQFPLTLTFEKAGKAEVTVWVEDKDQKAEKKTNAHQHH